MKELAELKHKKHKDREEYTFYICNKAYFEKRVERTKMLKANTTLMSDINKYQRQIKNTRNVNHKEILDKLCNKHTVGQIDKPLLYSIIKNEHPETRYKVKMIIKNNDDDNYYLQVHNNVNAKDYQKIVSIVRKLLQRTKNKTTRISSKINIERDSGIIKAYLAGVKVKDIASKNNMTYADVRIVIHRVKKRFKIVKPVL